MAKHPKTVTPCVNETPLERLISSHFFLSFVPLILWSSMVWFAALNLLIFQTPTECSSANNHHTTSTQKGI
ncbi:MAG: hypothetical protein Q9O24_02645 [Gammaproteobacteria bacterium]|nr:hypothetical protein [Gammaproteobacteria bacterium]